MACDYPVILPDEDPDAHFLAAVETLVGASLAGIGHIAPLQPKLDLRSAASAVADMLAQKARAGSVSERGGG